MKPRIDLTRFGSITIDGTLFRHDVVIRMDGRVKKRKKKLSKAIYGTSHVVSLDEARHVFNEGAKQIIIGSGQYGRLDLSEESRDYFRRQKCEVTIKPTPDAIQAWNKAEGAVIGLFHVTC